MRKRFRGLAGRLLAVTVFAVVLAVAALAAIARAGAVSQAQLPFRCFAQIGVDHVVFGPDSFFLPKTAPIKVVMILLRRTVSENSRS